MNSTAFHLLHVQHKVMFKIPKTALKSQSKLGVYNNSKLFFYYSGH